MRKTLAALALAAVTAAFVTSGPQPAPAAESSSDSFTARYLAVEEPFVPPYVSFVDQAGQARDLRDMKGKVVLVTVWATWCHVCAHEMPVLDELAGELPGEDFAVVPLSIDNDRDVIAPWYEEKGLANLPVYHDEGRVFAGLMGIRGTPTTFLIDKGGKVVGAIEGPGHWASPAGREKIKSYIDAAS